MKNFIFISPNFPTNYWQFCHHLKNNGFNVLGIGEQPYDELSYSLKGSLSSIEAANAIKTGILNVDNKAEVIIRPLADGGEGTVDALVGSVGATIALL